MDRWWLLAVLAVLLVGPAYAQVEGVTGPADTAPPGPAELYEDTQLLGAIRTLALTPEQLTLLATLNAQIRAERANLEALRAQVWEANQGDFAAVLAALRTGERVDPRIQRAADNALAQVRDAQASLADVEARAARTLISELSNQQAALVQTAEQAQARAARAARMAGFTSVGEYVAMELDAIRDLMADEYVMVAPAEARRVAANIVAQEAPDTGALEATAQAILQMMNQVRAWTAPVYTQQRETLPEQVEAALGIAGETAPVGYDDLLRLLRSERTAAAIALVTGSGGGEEQ